MFTRHSVTLAKVNKRFLTLRQEQEATQAESSHELSSCDIKSNLLIASRAEKVFVKGVLINRRGERNIPKRYLQDVVYATVGDDTGYFAKLKGAYFPIEFDFTHCFWYLVKYSTQKSCWESNKLPTEEYNLEIPDYHVVDQSEWGPIDGAQSDHSDIEDNKSEGHPESINIKSPQMKKKNLKES